MVATHGLDGTYDAWVRGYRVDVATLPDPGGHGPLLPLAGGFVFPVRHYLSANSWSAPSGSRSASSPCVT